MKRLLQLKLLFLSRLLLKKYKPEIIAISGSVGKTSAKEAIFHVLSGHLSVRTSIKNYNNEIGVPLTIIGCESAGSSLFGWINIFWRAWRLYFWRDSNYPKILILEMGIDRPGDMDYLTRLAPPTVGVMTGVSYSHLEYFGSLQNIKKEKQILIERVSRKGISILNYDNEASRSMSEFSPARVLSFGFLPGADIIAQNIHYHFQDDSYDIAGLNFKLNYEGNIVPVEMPHVLGENGVYAALAATAVALYFGLNLMQIAESLRIFRLPPGRMQLLPGIKHTFLIDDSYNSSPEACLAAIKVLGEIKIDSNASKYAVLGDMLEIGAYSEEGHVALGRALFERGIDYLISVGERSRDIDRGAKEAGMSSDFIFHFDDSATAGLFVQERLREGDVVLIKGSQGMRMEKVSLELMAEPDRASELLVRQGPAWHD